MGHFQRRVELAAARKAAGHTQESLSAALGVDRTTVATWESGEHMPMPHVRPLLARELGCSLAEVGGLVDGEAVSAVAVGELAEWCAWVDARAGWEPGTCRAQVEAGAHSGVVGRDLGRRAVAEAMRMFYGGGADAGVFRAVVGGVEVVTSVATRPGWLDLRSSLVAGDGLELSVGSSFEVGQLGEVANWAARRLAEAAASGGRLTDSPLYRLVDVSVASGVVEGRVGVASFVDYALTVDVLEREVTAGRFELRRALLPDLASVFDVGGRLCVGGVPALCAIARPGGDYVVLVQERSRQVVNAAGRLAVIPKGFHGPLNDVRADVRLVATVLRELEEELFGRGELDSTTGGVRAAAPMHPDRLSAPMRWLMGAPERLRVECTGFGLNLVSGNYEFAGLVVVKDERFWEEFGGSIEANWESAGLMLYSTRDADSMKALIADDRWSNEGLFALLLGVRRLREIGEGRVELPAVEWGVG